MNGQFNSTAFIKQLGERLIAEFAFAAAAGTPGLIGTAREHPARKQLEKLLPAFASVGTGQVIDSYGDVSKQQDIVVYERDFCPVYSINDTPEATYFPVEGVIAVGEVKSEVDKMTIFDALDKIASAKKLKRYSFQIFNFLNQLISAEFRPYGMGQTIAPTPAVDFYDQQNNFNDQVFGFVLCKSFKYSGDAVLQNINEYVGLNGKQNLPNLIISLHDGFIQAVTANLELQRSALTANGMAFVPDTARAFAYLVNELRMHSGQGRTVPVTAFDRYIRLDDAPLPECQWKPFPQI